MRVVKHEENRRLKHCVTIDAATVRILTRYGDGKLSRGISEAAKLVEKQNVLTFGRDTEMDADATNEGDEFTATLPVSLQ